MIDLAWKLLPLLAGWFLCLLAIARLGRERKKPVLLAAAAGHAGGVGTAVLLLRSLPGDLPYFLVRSTAAGIFIALLGGAALACYRAANATFSPPLPAQGKIRVLLAGAGGMGLIAGGMSAFRWSSGEAFFAVAVAILVVAGLLLAAAAGSLERYLPDWLPLTRQGLLVFGIAVLLLLAAQTPRLDIFAPLTMKVTKFSHDFVHQFFESMLIPDHPFFRDEVWAFIGLLFSQEVGFWGGVIIWFAPIALVLVAIARTRLPAVTYIRQGAQRRKVLAGYFHERRRRAIVPLLAAVVLLLAVFQSRFPAVEYWDPQPVEVAVTAAGEIFIPRTSDAIDLADGRLHKFLFRDGAAAVRFFVLRKETGKLAVVLDACAICPPDGYGQAPGVVICYACKTLIPLETVGLPGGCNPVPVKFEETPEGVRIQAVVLINTWQGAVQPAKPVPGRGR